MPNLALLVSLNMEKRISGLESYGDTKLNVEGKLLIFKKYNIFELPTNQLIEDHFSIYCIIKLSAIP